MADPLSSGDYARKQIYCPSRVVAWSHTSRFRLASHLAAAYKGRRLLDYGCGDGTFLALSHGTFARAIGADIDRRQLEDCRRRFSGMDGIEFVHVTELEGAPYDGAFDVVTCMETLEHCPDPERVRLLDDLARLAARGGRVVISVPIEIGPALAGKQLFRALAAWRGHGDYRHRETYTPGELAAAVLGRPNLARARYELDTPEGPVRYCGHKGFDWRVLEREVRARFDVERRLFSPLAALGAFANSQAWFVCRTR